MKIYCFLCRFILCLCSIVICGNRSWAARPMVHYHDLVAGEKDPGYRDGPFWSALFDFPQGLAINEKGNQLFVADRDNHCVRLIQLDNNNQVSTLAVSDQAGYRDGDCSQALFKSPTALALLPNNRLTVYDRDNKLIRLIDLDKKWISTLCGSASGGVFEGPADKIDLTGVFNMAYLPSEDALYFSRPLFGMLQKLDLKTLTVSIVLYGNKDVPQPGPLCIQKDHICVADIMQPNVEMITSQTDKTGKISYSLTLVGTATRARALAAGANGLYVIQDDGNTPCARIDPYQPVSLVSTGGLWLDNQIKTMTPVGLQPPFAPFWNFQGHEDFPGFIADPLNDQRFFIASSYFQGVISVRDYHYGAPVSQAEQYSNADGLCDYDYPIEKPQQTFRLLMLGDSEIGEAHAVEVRDWPLDYERIQTIPKRLELYLNTEAALDNVPENYQILQMSRSSDNVVIPIWAYYLAAAEAEKFDVDEICCFVTSREVYCINQFFERPLNKDQVPALQTDPEFLMRPYDKKVETGLQEDFLHRCLKMGLAQVGPNGSTISFKRGDALIVDSDLRKDMEQLMGRPLALLSNQVKNLRTKAGQPVRFFLCYCPGGPKNDAPEEDYRQFWKDICDQNGIPMLDLTEPWTTLQTTYYPTNDSFNWGHFDSYGASLVGYILTHELIRQSWVPFPTPSILPEH